MKKMTEHAKERFSSKDNLVMRPQYPESLNIELNNTCNHQCLFCGFHGKYAHKIEPCIMNKDLAMSILEKASSLGLGKKELGLYASGEVLLYKELPEIIRYAKKLGFGYIFITTNGSLGGNLLMKEIIDAGIDSIRFSVNAGTRKTYKYIHGRDDFEDVVSNIRFLKEYVSTLDKDINISLSSVITKKTMGETAMIKEMFEPWVDEILFIPVMGLEYMSEELDEELSLPAYAYGVEKRDPDFVCPLPFNTLYVDASGKVRLCCQAWDANLELGDMKDDVIFEDIWYCEAFEKIRKGFLEHDVSNTFCNSCHVLKKGTLTFMLDNNVGQMVIENENK